VKKYLKQMVKGLLILCLFLGIINLAAAETEKENKEPLVTATFFDSDLRESLNEVSMQIGVAFICDDNVKGIITMELKNVPLEKALRMMVSGGGFMFRKIDDYYLIGLPDPRSYTFQMLCETAVYSFKNISIESARALIPDSYKDYIKLDTEKGMAMIKAPSSLISEILADLAKIDGAKAQIRIKALVTEIRNEVLKNWGMNLMNIDFNPTATESGTKTLALNLTKGTLNGEGNASFGHFSTTINALVNDKKATIHADPVLLVTEGKSGELFVGEKRTLILYSTGTSSTTSSTENVEAGVTLKVTPKIVGDQIELTIAQKVSDFDDDTTDEIIVKSREYSSTVRFLPGQTVMVAGLTDKSTSDTTVKTPILGDIPLIGYLFKQKSKSKNDSEILIFLTAEVVK
jgi:type II secretory pathway component GspD/PulD (secretin)